MRKLPLRMVLIQHERPYVFGYAHSVCISPIVVSAAYQNNIHGVVGTALRRGIICQHHMSAAERVVARYTRAALYVTFSAARIAFRGKLILPNLYPIGVMIIINTQKGYNKSNHI